MPPSVRTPQAENVIAANIARRHMSKGQQAMAVAMVYPEPEKTTHGKVSKTKLLLETKTNFSGARLSHATCARSEALSYRRPTKYYYFSGQRQEVDGRHRWRPPLTGAGASSLTGKQVGAIEYPKNGRLA
jgi:hypothetical protein